MSDLNDTFINLPRNAGFYFVSFHFLLKWLKLNAKVIRKWNELAKRFNTRSEPNFEFCIFFHANKYWQMDHNLQQAQLNNELITVTKGNLNEKQPKRGHTLSILRS